MERIRLTKPEIKEIIISKLESGIDFKELRKELPVVSRREIKLLVLEIMAEKNLTSIPFEGLIKQKKERRVPLTVNTDGSINISDILMKKELNPENCVAFYSIGGKKITLTVKEKIGINE